MPRRLLRDARVVDDDWVYRDELAGLAATPDSRSQTPPASGLILRFEEWSADKPRWLATGRPLGVILQPAQKIETLVGDLPSLALVGADFPGPTDGRGYTQGRLLRERHGFSGELRAVGYVRRDQVFFLARCGFNSFELPEAQLHEAEAALDTFSAEYQPANDAGLRRHLLRR